MGVRLNKGQHSAYIFKRQMQLLHPKYCNVATVQVLKTGSTSMILIALLSHPIRINVFNAHCQEKVYLTTACPFTTDSWWAYLQTEIVECNRYCVS